MVRYSVAKEEKSSTIGVKEADIVTTSTRPDITIYCILEAIRYLYGEPCTGKLQKERKKLMYENLSEEGQSTRMVAE